MENRLMQPNLTAHEVEAICLYCEIARTNESHTSLKEILPLLPSEIDEGELQEAWVIDPILSQRYELRSGFVIPRNRPSQHDSKEVQEQENQRRWRAEKRLQAAQNLTPLLKRKNLRLLSVSGSTSYRTGKENDDIDFFSITARDTMWLSLTRALIVTRIIRLFNKESPLLCLSCTMDESYALNRFRSQEDPLIARDALNVFILDGEGYYRELLAQATWISKFYPRLYRELAPTNRNLQSSHRRATSPITCFVNLLLYRTVGTYIKVKSHLLNRRLSQQRRFSSIFELKIGKDHLIYESSRYSQLRQMYAQLARVSRFD